MDIKIQLPTPHVGQLEVLNSKAKFKVLQCGRRWGKSALSQIVAIQRMLVGGTVGYVTPTYSLAKAFYKEVLSLLPEAFLTTSNKSDLLIETITNGSIQFFSGDSEKTLDSSFRGKKYSLIIVDEAAYIDLEDAWWGAIYPTLSQYEDSEAILVSTPNGRGFFDKLYQKGLSADDSDWQSFHYPTNTNPHFPLKEFERARKSLPGAKFNVEYLAITGENVSNPIGSEHIAMNTITTLSTEPTVVYSADLASTYDFTVVIGLDQWGCMTYFDRFQRSWTDTIQAIAALPVDVTKVIDATGVGAVCYDTLLNMGVQNLHGFKFNTETKPQIMTELIRDIQAGRLKFNEKTALELSNLVEIKTATGYSKYQAYSGHDDCVMSLAMANHYKIFAVQSANWKLYFA